ncbi:GNAT family N-acetyltransferase [Enterobacter hormaechei]
MSTPCDVKLRPLEREDLRFVHQLDNNASVMRYWFEEPYEAFVELSISTISISTIRVNAGLWWSAKVKPGWLNWLDQPRSPSGGISNHYFTGAPGKGLASRAAKLAMDYGFNVLNLYKLYLIVDKENEKAIHIYRKLGFMVEGELIHEFFINGEYRNTIRMCIFQHQHLAGHNSSSASLLNPPRSNLRGFILNNIQCCF